MPAVDLTATPPEDIPAALQAGIDKLSSPLKTLLKVKVVPYIIQHRLGGGSYVTIEDLADRWDTPQIARTMDQRNWDSVKVIMASPPKNREGG